MNQRLCTLTSPLGDALRFSRMQVSERMNGLFTMQIEAVSKKPDIAPAALLGKPVTVTVKYEDGFERHYHGYVTRIAIGQRTLRDAIYHLTAHPWLWFLTRTSDCRIFQNLSLPDVIEQVFADEPAAEFVSRLADRGRYEPWEYCVQYRETDFNFVSRLLEQEGIGYCFEHEQGRHALVLVDSKDGHKPIDGTATIPYVPDGGEQAPRGDYVLQWQVQHEIQPGQVAIDDYDFKAPGNDLTSIRRAEPLPGHPKADYEIYDYPGEFDRTSEGESYAANRIEEYHGQAQVFEGSGLLRAFQAGRTFKLSEHPGKEQNTEYLLVSVDHDYREPAWDSSGGEAATVHCRFTAIPQRQQYRPPRTTPRPIVQGIQTAVVAGPEGDEIHTDEYGRIRVKFPWDRADTSGDKTSCWLRVAFLAAGPGFGFVSIPRIGHEVVVDFLEGDPDRPLVTGVVYNGSNLPPWALPANKTQSGLLTRSSLGGGADNANAIRFEDKKGAEEVWIHAEKDQRIEVENDESHTVGHDRKKSVGHDETTKIGHDRTETVGNDETVDILKHRKHTVAATDTLQVALQRTHLVGANESIAIGGAQEIAVGAAQLVTVGLVQMTKIGKDNWIDIGQSQTTETGAHHTTVVGGERYVEVHGNQTSKIEKNHEANVEGDEKLGVVGERKTSIGKDDSLTVAQNLVIDAGDSITIKTGSASIVMKKDGTITISGAGVTIEGSKDVTAKAPKVTTEASAKNVVKGAMVEVDASGVNTIKGSLVKIN